MVEASEGMDVVVGISICRDEVVASSVGLANVTFKVVVVSISGVLVVSITGVEIALISGELGVDLTSGVGVVFIAGEVRNKLTSV